jgi:hypothetical protein
MAALENPPLWYARTSTTDEAAASYYVDGLKYICRATWLFDLEKFTADRRRRTKLKLQNKKIQVAQLTQYIDATVYDAASRWQDSHSLSLGQLPTDGEEESAANYNG